MLKRIEEILGNKKWSKYKLSQESGLPYSTVNAFWHGYAENKSIETVAKIAKALEVTIDYLYYGVDEKLTYDEKFILELYRKASDNTKIIAELILTLKEME